MDSQSDAKALRKEQQAANFSEGILRLRAGERPASVARALKPAVHPQTVYGWARAERALKRKVLLDLVELVESMERWTGNPSENPAMRLRRDLLLTKLMSLKGNRL